MMAQSASLTPATRPVALVTGARGGLGRGIAWHLADAGFDLVLSDIVDGEDATTTLDGARERGAQAHFILHDLAEIATHTAFVAQVAERFGRLDCLVNNAGIQVPRRVSMLEVNADEFDPVIDVNLRGTFFLTQAVARHMCADIRAHGARTIISITSANAALASTDKAAYCLAKSALSMMSALFALELGAHDIQVFEIRPGLMATNMTRTVRGKYARQIEHNTLFKRWGEPDDVGRAVAALATGAIPYASGEVINVDGGLHLGRL